jgi:hypothetical protein
MVDRSMMGNGILILALVVVTAIMVSVLPTAGQHSVFAQATNMTKWSDPHGNFSVSYPTNWTVTPASNRFESPLVKSNSGVGPAANVDIIKGSVTDPEAIARQIANYVGIQYTLFQNVECAKYKIDGQKACSLVLTKQADPNLGTSGDVVMQVFSYVNGRMYVMTFGAPPDTFDSVLPTFEAMIASFKAIIYY